MSLLDISIITVLAIGAMRGLFRGLIKEAAALTAILLGGWLAYRFHEPASVLLAGMLPQPAARVVSFILLLLLVGFAAHIFGNILTGIVKLALLGWVNRLGGILMGLAEGALVLGMVFYTIMAVPFSFPLKNTVDKHPVARHFVVGGGMVLDWAKSMRQPAR